MSDKPPPPPPAYSQPPAPQGYGQPPPPQGYPGSTTVVVTQPGFVNHMMFREFGVQMQCPHCQATITTSTRYEVGTLTWIACCVIAAVGCWLGCCFIPFCVDGCKDVIHACPSCRQDVGRYNRL
uniref:Lipopolysaccharide-induced tumor necrosis factor-alpha factor-like isoform X3 n=1 Tax=Crassostrea virginica TaxID=6565 RepID=A0A8B8CSQ2_CRAVI|nr:lipopolysaccharide-induced tumor necrosis factor-alpha factor-like isoform X3 [Crassostrea virginica]